METLSRKRILGFVLCLLVSVCCSSVIFAGPPPPAVNTIQHGVGLNYLTIEARDFFFRGVNLTDLFITIAEYISNYTGPIPVWEPTVEWGLVQGTSGDWFNHTLPYEPVAILLQMHNTNYLYDGVLVIPVVYDKTTTQWQLGLFWVNGTQIDDDLLIMYHMRWQPGLDDPNEPQLPAEEIEEPR